MALKLRAHGSLAPESVQLDTDLQQQYREYIIGLSKDMELFMGILSLAFAPDISIAFDGSVSLAKEMGVPTEEILDTKEKMLSYFLD